MIQHFLPYMKQDVG